VKLRNAIATLGLIGLLVGAGTALAGDVKPSRQNPTFGALRPASADTARAQALAWFKSIARPTLKA